MTFPFPPPPPPTSPPPPPPPIPLGQLASSEETDGPSEDISTSLEVGLLGHMRKVLMLIPDSLVHTVVGTVIHHDCLIAMAHNEDIVVRTAVIRVSPHSSTVYMYKHTRAHTHIYTHVCTYMHTHILLNKGNRPLAYLCTCLNTESDGLAFSGRSFILMPSLYNTIQCFPRTVG